MPKVSIVLPTYNGEKYIESSINSVLNQTFTDFELIIVNDCSTDSTPKIIEDFAKKDSRIRIIHNKENKKLPEALNIGFRASKGEYLSWTSDDNLYLPEAFDTMVKFLDENKDVYLVCGDSKLINDKGEFMGDIPSYSNDTIYINDYLGSSFLYRREVINDIGEYDTSMFLVEDYDSWVRLYNKYGYIHRIPKHLYFYRIHNNSLTSTRVKDIRNQLNKLREKNGIWKYFENKGELPIELYYDYLKYQDINFDFINKMWGKFPGLKTEYENLKDGGINKDIIIFGAGLKGKEASKVFGDKVKFFVDNNKNKVGSTIDGKEIISFEELLKIHDKYDIIVAVSPVMTLEIMEQLRSNGINHFISWNIYEIILEGRKLW